MTAKREYAHRLVLLRDAELTEQRANREVARARLELVAVQALRVEHRPADVDDRPFVKAVSRAEQTRERDRSRAGLRQRDVDRFRAAWDLRRHAADLASAFTPVPPAPTPRILPPATGANEGPSEGFQHLPLSSPGEPVSR
jgi:hypothetical protein